MHFGTNMVPKCIKSYIKEAIVFRMPYGRALGRQMEATGASYWPVPRPLGGPILSRRVKSSPPGLVVKFRRGPGRTLRKHRPCCVGRHISYYVETCFGPGLGLARLGLHLASLGPTLASLDVPLAFLWVPLSLPQ